jgi:hypothetical protein
LPEEPPCTQFAPLLAHTGCEGVHGVTSQVLLLRHEARAWEESQRVVVGVHPQLPWPMHKGSMPVQAASDCQVPLLQVWRAAEPDSGAQRLTPLVQAHVPLESTHTGLSPLQVVRLCQAPLVQRWGVLLWQRTSLAAHAHVAVASTHTGLSPEHAVWLTQAPLIQRWGVLPWQRTSLAVH